MSSVRRLCALLLMLSLANFGYPAEPDWPFYVPSSTQPPAVEDDGWIRNEIDRFVLQKLEEHDLQPSPEAAKRTLVRRLYFDLLGLPPTPQAVEDFVRDDAEDAYPKLVDRLLDDSRYGERWARFWLDLARYADTAGYEGDPDLPHAWRYRDYVIDAFNQDKPYDQFIKEQLAGDEFQDIMGAGELPLTSPERTVAMTFLRLAPFTEPRGDETRHEMLSEITSTVGSVFLGLTVGCAKCHDHKHDDIPTADFYRMKAFFATIQIPPPERGDAYQIGGSLAADFYRTGEQDWAAQRRAHYQEQRSTATEKLAQLKRSISDRLGDHAIAGGSGFGVQVLNKQSNDYVFEERVVNDGGAHLGVITSDGQTWNVLSEAKAASLGKLSGSNAGKWFASLADPQHLSLGRHTAGSGEPADGEHVGKFAEIMIYDHPLEEAELAAIRRYFGMKYRDDGERAESDQKVKAELPRAGLRFWLDAGDVDADPDTVNPQAGTKLDHWVDRIGRLQLQQTDASLQPTLSTLGDHETAAVEFDADFLRGPVTRGSFLKDKAGSIVVIYSARHQHEGYGFEVGGNGQFLSTVVHPGAKKPDDRIAELIRNGDPRIRREEGQQYEFLSTRDRYVKQHLKRLQPVAMSLRHSFGPPYEPGVPVSRVMVRGEYDNPGEVVEPGFLSVITGTQDPATIRLDPFKRWPTRSRRMTLAKWIASPENPMTARVMVNRLWHWHFGQGIVRTPSDFGYLSGGPSHRELLDWLAERFVKDKWSVKAIHRLILNSATYRQSSTRLDERANRLDPDNRLLWRFNRMRLDAEAVRDNVLSVSGRLNPEQFGLPIFPPLPGDVAEAVKYSESKWDTQYGPEGRKRSIYIYQQRTLTMPLMQTFDSLVCEESRPRRRSSVTPLQALAMYNGEFVNDEAKFFAARVQADVAEGDAKQKVARAFQLALGRSPTETESKQLHSLMAESGEDALLAVCRVLLNTNEFMYVD